ncbi:MAG: hypothetical protein HY226_04095 [Candidatus Vogelbacteria bacterium]|nr:hypothetical protein [Candidatus Vogelbacteria bacterium]
MVKFKAVMEYFNAIRLLVGRIFMRPKLISWRLVILVFLLLPTFSYADSSNFTKQISYQGKLTDATGVTVADGKYNIEFNLYNTSTGGATLWTNTLIQTDRVQVTNGLFSVMLGATSTSLTSIDFNQPLYLSIKIGGVTDVPVWDGEMTPRKTLGTVPYAFNADAIDGLDSTAFVRTDATSTVATSSTDTLLTLNQLGTGDVFDAQGSGSTFLIVTNAGDIGIGTTSPLANLSIQGSNSNSTVLAGQWVTNSNYGFLSLNGNNASGANFLSSLTDHNLVINRPAGAKILFTENNGLGQMIIDTGGNIGIGTTSPYTRLSVVGGVVATNFTATSSTAVSTINGPIVLASAVQLSVLGSGSIPFATTVLGVPGIINQDNGNFHWDFVNQRLGIGTSTPWARLSVAGPSINLTNSPIFTVSTSTAVSTSTVFIINSNGLVGIGTTTPAHKLEVENGALCVSTSAGDCGSAANTSGDIYYNAAHANYTDIAEKYPSYGALVPAEIVALDLHSIDSSGIKKPYVKPALQGDTAVIGVVSTKPGLTLGDAYGGSNDYSIALSGRVPVKVSMESGPIATGDKITLSSVAGVGMKAEGIVGTLGVALESYNGEPDKNSQILVFVQNNYNGLVEALKNPINQKSGVSLSDVVDYLSRLGAKISDSIATFKDLLADTVTIGSPSKRVGITMYDEESGAPYCLSISGYYSNYK